MIEEDLEEDLDFYLKVVIVGDSGVGKTNLLTRYTKNTFYENTKNTIGVDFFGVDMNIRGKSIKTQFWDTAGQETYQSMANAYYKNSLGAILVYDITRPETFQNLNKWVNLLKEHANPDILIFLVGNKSDLASQRKVSKEEAENFSKKNNMFFKEVSAKENYEQLVHKAFNTLLEEIVKVQEKEEMSKNDFISKLHRQSLGKKKTENDNCCS
jgi:small GTP-binding protein